MTSYLLRAMLHSPNAVGRMMRWAVELGEYGLEYQPRSAIKFQMMADFIAKFTVIDPRPESTPNFEDQLGEPDAITPTSIVHSTDETTNKASCSISWRGQGTGLYFVRRWLLPFERVQRECWVNVSERVGAVKYFLFGFPTSSKALYEALLIRLKLAKAIGANKVKGRSDS